jgi:hypothetical protein
VLTGNGLAPAIHRIDFPPRDLSDSSFSPTFSEIAFRNPESIEGGEERHFAPAWLEIH